MEPKTVILQDLLSETRDGDWGEEIQSAGYIPYKVIRGTDFPSVRYGNLSSIPIRYISESSRSRRTLQANDIIIETAGGSREHPTGRTLLVTERLLADSNFPITCASFCRFLRVDHRLADPQYVYWYLQYLYEIGVMWQHQVQHTGLSRFQYTRFATTERIPVPDPFQQHAIVSILNTLDDKIELNRQMNKTLEAIAQALFRSWFVDFDPVCARMEGRQPYGMDAETAALFPDSFEDSVLGEIPKGWRVGCLGDIADNSRLGVHPEDIPFNTAYIGLEHMPRKSIALSEWGNAEEVASNKFWFHQGDILFGKLRPYFHKVGVAVQDGVCSTDILVIVPQSPEWYGSVLSHISSVEFINYANASSDGTRMPRTNWHDMKRYKIAMPSKDIAQIFSEKIKLFVLAIRSNILQSRTLADIRNALLPKLLSGEIRVKDAEKRQYVKSCVN